jgi:hypothetical protein
MRVRVTRLASRAAAGARRAPLWSHPSHWPVPAGASPDTGELRGGHERGSWPAETADRTTDCGPRSEAGRPTAAVPTTGSDFISQKPPDEWARCCCELPRDRARARARASCFRSGGS